MLIIEDDEPFIELMRATLGLRDVRVAHTIREAMAMIDESPSEIILLDLSLPDSPLTQTIDRIHELKTRSQDATVIVITGHDDVQQLEADIIKAGAKTVLSKDHGFFSSLSDALVSSGWIQTPCASQSIVEKIEETVKRMVAPE
jgi:ActR/RegA family two-component response regulator